LSKDEEKKKLQEELIRRIKIMTSPDYDKKVWDQFTAKDHIAIFVCFVLVPILIGAWSFIWWMGRM